MGLFGGSAPGAAGGMDWQQILSILGAGLQDAGSGYQGRSGGALAGLQQHFKTIGDQKQYQDQIKGLFGSAMPNQVQVTPQVTPQNPAGSPSRQAAYSSDNQSFTGPLGKMLPFDQASALQPMLQNMTSQQGFPVALNAMQDATQRQQALQDRATARDQQVQDKTVTTLSPEELAANGFRPGSVVQRDAFNGLHVGQASDMKSQGAVDQTRAEERFKNNLPMTSYQQAELGVNRDRLAMEQSKFQAGIPDENTLRDMATRYIHGDKGVATGMSRNAMMQTAFQNMIAQVGREQGMKPEQISQNQQTFSAAGKTVEAFDKGKQGDTVRSLNVSVSHLETLRELGKALQNGDINLVNAAKQHFAETFGVPAPTNFDAARAIVADEVAKGVIGGQTAQSDRETLADTLRRSRSPQQIDGAIGTFQDLLGGQLRGLRQQYKSSTGREDFNEKLFPETVQRLDPPKGNAKAANVLQQAPIRILADADYNRLPSGALFVGPDGVKRRKP